MSSPSTNQPKGLTTQDFNGVVWFFTSTAIILSIGRFLIRKRTMGKFQADDYIHAFALLVLIPYISVSTVLFPLHRHVSLWGAKLGPKPTESMLHEFFQLELTIQLLFWIILYSIKFTFLILYRHIFGISKSFRKWWWGVFLYTWLAFLASFLTGFWTCDSPSKLFVLKSCLSQSASSTINNFAAVGTALNISSDLAIMILPLWMVRGLKLPPSKKIGLACLFCVGLVIIIIDALRLATGDGGGVISSASMYNALEPAIAVIVSCLPTFRALLPAAGESSKWKGRPYRYDSSSHRSGKSRITVRHQNEGYELASDSPAPARPPGALLAETSLGTV